MLKPIHLDKDRSEKLPEINYYTKSIIYYTKCTPVGADIEEIANFRCNSILGKRCTLQ